MRDRRAIWIWVLLVALSFIPFGCKKPAETPAEITQPATTEPEPPPPEPEEPEVVTEGFPTEPPVETAPGAALDIDALNRQGLLKTVYFAFDSYELDPDTRAALGRNADWLKQNPDRVIRIEGHCDERGTIEYNIALGQRRASAVRNYLVSLGVDASRIRIVSYGEERPANPGHNEAAWAENRRAESRIEG